MESIDFHLNLNISNVKTALDLRNIYIDDMQTCVIITNPLKRTIIQFIEPFKTFSIIILYFSYCLLFNSLVLNGTVLSMKDVLINLTVFSFQQKI